MKRESWREREIQKLHFTDLQIEIDLLRGSEIYINLHTQITTGCTLFGRET